MMSKKIFVSDFDMKRFKWLIDNSGRFNTIDTSCVPELAGELSNAVIMPPPDVPNDIITMSTRFEIEYCDNGEKEEFMLVFPFDADAAEKKLSVLSPVGIAALGCRKGEVVTLDNGRSFRISDIIYQPEAQGQYYL